MSSRHREAFEEFAGRAETQLGDSLEKLVLYGSVARGEESESSDVDVFAVVEKEDQKELVRDLAFETGLEYEVSFSPIVKSVEEYESVKDSAYGREVRSTGEIYV
jgi:predicted nucleotidyltransferase